MAGVHSILSPSKLAQIVACPGSLAMAKGLPQEPSSKDAASGTLTHSLAQYALETGYDPHFRIGETVEVDGFKFKIDQDRTDRVKVYIDALHREPHDEMYVEVKLNTSGVLGVQGQSGTADAVLLHYESKTISVHDLKDGVGIVYADDNPQLATYGAAALDLYSLVGDWDRIKVCIHQPRMDHYSERTYTVEELEWYMSGTAAGAQIAYELYDRGTRAQILDALTPGEKQCRWCPVRGNCPARNKAVLDLFPTTGEDPLALELTDDEIAAALGQTDFIEAWCRDMRAEALRRALAGRHLPGYKVVQGKRGARKWIDEEKAELTLGFALGDDELYKPREIRTPTDIEKVLKRNKAGLSYDAVKDLVTQSEGSLSIVPESAAREEVTVTNLEFGVVA